MLTTIATGALLLGAAAGPAAADDRGYELVSPVDKNLGEAVAVTRAAATGDTATFPVVVPQDTSRSGPINPFILARRAADGWLRFSADPLTEGVSLAGTGTLYSDQILQISDDGTKALILTKLPLDPADTDTDQADLYLEDVATGATQLVSAGPVDGTISQPEPIAVSTDWKHVVFRASGALTADANGSWNVYDWDNGTLHVASILPAGTAATSPTPGSVGTAWNAAPQPILPVTIDSPMATRSVHSVSDDGSRIFFRQGANSYVRIDNTTTVPLSISKRTVAGGVAAGTLGQSIFMGSDPNGTFAYFFSNQQLTDAATLGGGVYRYDIDSDQLTLVTPATAGGTNSTVQQGGGTSQDGSTLYFVAKGAMTAGAVVNQFNWYVYTPGDGTSLIATTVAAPSLLRITPDGRYVVFESSESLAGAQTGGYKAIYRYDRNTATLTCISCRSDAAPSTANASLISQLNSSWSNPVGLLDGGQVVFGTQDQLLPEDTDTAFDVYLYDGGLQLISGGAGSLDSYVGDASADAKDVFFTTRAAILPEDTDGGLVDVYDARVGGGFPEPPAAPAPSCVGIACAAAPPARVGVPSAGSTAAGGSNATPEAQKGSRVEIQSLSATTRRLLARRGWASVRVEVTGGGTLVLVGRATVGGRLKTIGTARRHVLSTETVTRSVVLRLSKSARRQLSRTGHLSVRLVARVGGLAGPGTATEKLTLKWASR